MKRVTAAKSVSVKDAKKTKARLSTSPSYNRSGDFFTTPERLAETLELYGVAVIPSLLTPGECEAMETGFWDSLAKLSSTWEKPISRTDETSWVGLLKLFPMHSMLIQHYGIGHAEFVWALRQNPSILAVFTRLWGVNDPTELLVTMFFLWRESEIIFLCER